MIFTKTATKVLAMPKFALPLAVLSASLMACSPNINGNILNNYFDTVRKLGMTPVYPPREELQVGDVFFTSWNPEKENDRSSQTSVWITNLSSVRDAANSYLRTRINYANTVTASTPKAPQQTDFSSGSVATNAQERVTLPIVSFPSVSGSATTAGSFGALGFIRSFGLGFGSSASMSINFTDTRAFGIPYGGTLLGQAFDEEFGRIPCDKIYTAVEGALFSQSLTLETRGPLCKKPRKCTVDIVTNTYLTRKIEYSYSSAKIAQLAASSLNGTPRKAPENTLAIPGNVSVDITVGEDADGSDLQGLISALQGNTSAAGGANEAASFNFVGIQGNSLKFDRVYQKPIAVAYEAVNYDAGGSKLHCDLEYLYKKGN